MKGKTWFILIGLTAAVAITGAKFLSSAEISEKDCFFMSSLHHTGAGMKHWYNQEQGGFQKITGIIYEDQRLDCTNCHIPSCDKCHKKEEGTELTYSTTVAKNQQLCLKCHKRQKKMIFDIDQPRGELDVHFATGMECLDCHTSREIHGDGTAYKSLFEKGAIETRCENCHEELSPITSHKIHREKLDCSACHTRRVVTCYNCHFETLTEKKKRVSVTITDWVFLINRDGKVTSANFQSLVYQGRPFVVFAPFFSHSVMKQGRKCDECHRTEIVKMMEKKKVQLTWFENQELKSVKGVVPVVDGKLDLMYLDYKDGKWIPLKDAPTALVQLAPYGQSITPEQLEKLLRTTGK